MKKKLTILAFGLLLAVGWTSDASAQLLPKYEVAQLVEEGGNAQRVGIKAPVSPAFANAKAHKVEPMTMKAQSSSMMKAPRRAQSATADAVHPRSWYANYQYTWYDANNASHPANLTDTVTNPYQMIYLAASTYVTPAIPGILYSGGWNEDVAYPGIKGGYNIFGTQYNDIRIRLTSSNAATRYIKVCDATSEETLQEWSGGTLPSGWSSTSTLQSTTSGGYTWYYMNGGGSIYIPHSVIDGHDSIYVSIRGIALNGSTTDRIWVRNNYKTLSSTASFTRFSNWYGGIDRPTENGYTVFMVKLKDDADFSNVTAQTNTFSELVTFFDTYVQSMELMTDGLRVGEGTDKAGTVFSYTGILDKFFFISKGKMYWVNGDRAPYYSMYEEFSPYVESQTANQKDLYANMTAGEYYPIVHDCQSVMYMKHYFSMAGKDTIAPKSVSSLVFYIPDNRGREDLERTYVEEHQPQVGLYTIRLAAETAPSSTYAQDSTYTVYLDWTSSLNQMVNNTVGQTYVIYKVEFDDHGNRVYTYLDTVEDILTYQYNEKQTQASQTFTYVILGYPTGATNKPLLSSSGELQEGGGNFFTYSNIDDVQIPGWFDFMVLYRERYESDFVINEQKNYYRNYLYPTNLAPGTGMTMGQLKQEWPNQTASYTLWRDNTGVAVLEVRGIGNKVYYRIRYYDDTQVKTGPNNITVPNYQTIPND